VPRSSGLLVLAAIAEIAGSLAWGMIVDGHRPARYDVTGALVCLAGVAVIGYASRRARAGRLILDGSVVPDGPVAISLVYGAFTQELPACSGDRIASPGGVPFV
jgi:hypothetical protein